MDILARRKSNEDAQIALIGFAQRTFQEDNNIRGSWGYTVGLTIEDNGITQPACIYMRAGIPDDTLGDLLHRCAAAVKVTPELLKATFTMGDYTIDGTSTKLKFKFRKIRPDEVASMFARFETPVEGQNHDTDYYWLWIGDRNNNFPGHKDYIDFKQTSTVEQVAEAEPDVVEEFLHEE